MLLFPLILLSLTGCATDDHLFFTQKLWYNAPIGKFNEPAIPPYTELYQGPKEVLVSYDESNEDSDAHRRRSYYLTDHNLQRISASKKPKFVSHPPEQLPRIPVVSTNDISSAPAVAALISPDGKIFYLLQNGTRKGPYDLPVYPAGLSTPGRIVLVPLAVVGDVTMISLFVGIYAWAHGAWSGTI